jgi:hypothetical protein
MYWMALTGLMIRGVLASMPASLVCDDSVVDDDPLPDEALLLCTCTAALEEDLMA